MKSLFLHIIFGILLNTSLQAEEYMVLNQKCENEKDKIDKISSMYTKIKEALPRTMDTDCSNIMPYLNKVTNLIKEKSGKDFDKCSFINTVFYKLKQKMITYIGPKSPPKYDQNLYPSNTNKQEISMLFLKTEQITSFCKHPNKEIAYFMIPDWQKKVLPKVLAPMPSPVQVSPDNFNKYLMAQQEIFNKRFLMPHASSPFQQQQYQGGMQMPNSQQSQFPAFPRKAPRNSTFFQN